MNQTNKVKVHDEHNEIAKELLKGYPELKVIEQCTYSDLRYFGDHTLDENDVDELDCSDLIESSEIVQHLRKSSEQGNGESTYLLAVCYAFTRDKEDKSQFDDANYETAFELLKLASDQGYGKASYELSYINFLELDNDENAVSFMELASEQGLDAAKFEIGLCYLFGQHGFVEDVDKALKFLKKASDDGVVDATKTLCGLYSNNKHGVMDLTGYEHYKLLSTEQESRVTNTRIKASYFLNYIN